MRRPCVRVARAEGEATRRALASADLLDRRYALDSDGEYVYLPVTDESAIDESYTVVDREVAPRDDQTVPEDLLEFRPTYERLGRLALLQEDDPDRAREAAEAIMASDLPIDAVLNRASAVEGQERVPAWTLLAGETTETIHREYGVAFRVDPTLAYFSPRLATERERVISQIEANERVFDMFAGVGPFAVRAAVAGATVVAVDINADAVAYCRDNAERNGVTDRITIHHGDVRAVADDYPGWADRIIMNLPHSAADFLPTARAIAADSARVHFYDIQPDDAPFAAGEAAIRRVFEPDWSVQVADTRIVRSYAPGRVNVCLDIDIERHDD